MFMYTEFRYPSENVYTYTQYTICIYIQYTAVWLFLCILSMHTSLNVLDFSAYSPHSTHFK